MIAPPNEKAGGPAAHRTPGNATKHPTKDTSAALASTVANDALSTEGTGSKRCTKCGENKPLTKFSRDKSKLSGFKSTCKECGRDASRQYRAANPDKSSVDSRRYRAANSEKAREYARRYRAANLEKVRESNRQYIEANPEKHRDRARQTFDRLRAEVFDHYGRACVCCGAADDLTIDHVNGDGGRHRAEIGATSSSAMYRWLIKNGFPEGFQTLCGPCNGSKGTGAACRLNHSSAVTS